MYKLFGLLFVLCRGILATRVIFMKKRTKLSSYKILAKTIINENPGRCAGSFFLIYGPRLFLLTGLALTAFMFSEKLLPVYAAAITVVLSSLITFFIDSYTVALGELFLSALSASYCGDIFSEEKTFKNLSAHLREYGMAKLIVLRVKFICEMIKDTVFSLLPIGIVITSVYVFAGASAIPTEAFFVATSGVLLAFKTVKSQLIMEYDKYRFVYSEKALFSENTSDRNSVEVVGASRHMCEEASETIKRCERSFLFWKFFVTVTLPFILPAFYFSVYKKVTMYTIIYKNHKTEAEDENVLSGAQTIVFNLANEIAFGQNAY